MGYSLAGVKPHVAAAANHFGPKHGIKDIGGFRAQGSVKGSDHPKGLALDFMTSNKAKGDALAADLIANAKAYNITYVIWWRRIYNIDEGQWKKYSGPSAHTDHVHASFGSTAGTGSTVNVGNPLIPDVAENTARALGDIASFLTDPAKWRKLMYYTAGALLLFIGVIGLAGLSVPGVKDVAKTAVKLTTKGKVK